MASTTLDELAGQAMAGLLANPKLVGSCEAKVALKRLTQLASPIAECACAVARATLDQRQKEKQQR